MGLQVPTCPVACIGQSWFPQQPVDGMQVAAAAHFFVPAVVHVKSHTLALQVAWAPTPVGCGQTTHCGPHFAIEVLSTQAPEQTC